MRAVHGWFAQWRWALVFATQLIFYGLPWLTWNGRQAVLFEITARKFYIFGLVLWPQDVIYLTALLVIAALFAVPVHGDRRAGCGAAMRARRPSTRTSSSGSSARSKASALPRMKLDRAGFSLRKLGVKAAKHGTWLALAAVDRLHVRRLFLADPRPRDPRDRLRARSVGDFWILFYGFATYGNAGFMREQVCKYMCPYARFQSAMFDRDTLIIAYDRERGEPRGPRSRKADPKAGGLGDCVDCNICVQVCPTGIDIRKGLQYECIGCAACIDGCDQVMDKMGYPKGLIRYASENALDAALRSPGRCGSACCARARSSTRACSRSSSSRPACRSALRNPLKVDVIRDRGALAREATPGVIENVYRLQIMNTGETAQAIHDRRRRVCPGSRSSASTSLWRSTAPRRVSSRCACRRRQKAAKTRMTSTGSGTAIAASTIARRRTGSSSSSRPPTIPGSRGARSRPSSSRGDSLP